MGNTATVIYVHIGDRKNPENFDPAVRIVLHDDEGQKSAEIKLDKFQFDLSQPKSLHQFPVARRLLKKVKLGNIDRLEFWRDDSMGELYVEKVMVDRCVFPIFRWVRPNCHLIIKNLDTCLPQHEEDSEQIRKELEEKRKQYVFHQNLPNLLPQVKSMPSDEEFSFCYQFDLAIRKAKLTFGSKFAQWTSGHWDRLSDLLNVYNNTFGIPKGYNRWNEDASFGAQRLNGLTPSLIRLCTAIPDKLPVTDELLKPLLQGLTIEVAIQRKRLFICDLGILEGLPVRDNFVLCSPIALFFVDDSDQLKPVAIQLFQKPGDDNPIFLPTDDRWTWTLAKMWYNNAEATIHQGVAHFGLTHLMMEGIAVCTHRQLAQSHPIFKLLAPHFRFLIAINNLAAQFLVNDGGWIDRTMNVGRKGMLEAIRRRLVTWRVDVDGTLPEELKARGVYDPNVLPGYYFRDDALLLYNAIKNYVTAYVSLYYDTAGSLTGDWQIQAWAAELVKERDDSRGGMGLKGVPGDGQLTCTDQLITVLTFVIYTSSVGHASVNFPQYDEYGFPPNYPALLEGQPPRDKSAMTEDDVIKTLPDKPTTLDIMSVTNLLSMRETNSLGDFPEEYIVEHEALKIVDTFRQELRDVIKVIKRRNTIRTEPYEYLNPDVIPNAISI